MLSSDGILISASAVPHCGVVGKSTGLVMERLPVRILAGAAGEFSSPELTSCADSLFGVRSTPQLPQWHVKYPGHSAKSAGGRLH